VPGFTLSLSFLLELIPMQRGCLIALVIVIVLGLILGMTAMSSYNGLVSGQEQITAKAAGIDSMYKRRYDLIPQLVSTVKGAADYESSTLQAVVDARASVGRMQLSSDVASDPDAMAAYMKAQDGLSSAIGRLFAVSEAYPQLRATEGFLALQDQIEGSENRIAVARGDFIEAVRLYNTKRRSFPANIMAQLLSFEEAPTLTSEPAVREVPVISFDDEG
jgi:LemA protein